MKQLGKIRIVTTTKVVIVIILILAVAIVTQVDALRRHVTTISFRHHESSTTDELKKYHHHQFLSGSSRSRSRSIVIQQLRGGGGSTLNPIAAATTTAAAARGGGGATKAAVSTTKTNKTNNNNNNKIKTKKQRTKQRNPNIYYAILHNWFYFLSLGFDLINLPFMIREIVDGENYRELGPTPKSIAISGKVESVDKLLTFCGIGFLSSLSDIFGRKVIMAWSAIGFALTNYLQAVAITLGKNPSTHHLAIPLVYVAKLIDGCSSCMLPLCQAYVTDCTPNEDQLATNLGIFSGLSSAGAFIFAFPIGGIVGAKYGPRVAILIASILQVINFLLIVFVTPESYVGSINTNGNKNKDKSFKSILSLIDWKESNPFGCLHRLFGSPGLLRVTSVIYTFASLARVSLDAQFPNYTNIRFGWTQAQSGPVLVLVGAMLTIAPKYFIQRWGLYNSILSGLFTFAIGLIGAGLATTPIEFIAAIAIVSVGCVCLPAITAVIANCSPSKLRGAYLGSLGSINELTGSIGFTLYAHILATFTHVDTAPFNCQGFHFVTGGILLIIAEIIALLPGGLLSISDKHDKAKVFSHKHVDTSLEVDM